MKIPERLLKIAEDIRAAGGRAFLVGGFVRDSLLGTAKENRDFDIEVYSISQEELLNILSKHGKPNLIGKAFGVVHLSRQKIHYDFSFPRIESKTGIGHRAFDVKTNPNLSFEEAAKRRDFTINAMGMELPNLELTDPYNGRRDLEHKILRHVSEAFAEDSLRVLRGVQFAARFGLKGAKETIELCKTLSLNDLSRERIEDEFRKWLLKGVKPSQGLEFFCDVGLQNMFPEIDVNENLGNFLDFLASQKEKLEPQEFEIIMFAGLLSSPNAKPTAFLKKWMPVNILLKKVPALLNSIPLLNLNDKSSLRRCALKAGGLKLPAIFKNIYDDAQKIGMEMEIWEKAPEPLVTGQMLLDMGFKPGPKIGEIMRKLFEMQLNGEIMTANISPNSIGLVQEKDFTFRSEQGFKLESGATLPELAIRYETYGDFKDGTSPVIWICSPLTMDAHAAGLSEKSNPKSAGWWDALIGPGKAIDTNIFFVVCSNILGGCKGTTGPSSIDPRTGEAYGSKFPRITITDMVNAQKKLADYLEIKKFFAVIGGSMGGFQALTWALEYPDFVERCVVIASGTRLSAQALGFEIVGRKIVLNDEKSGLANARMMANITYLSAESMKNRFDYAEGMESNPEKFYTGFAIENYLNHQSEKFIKRFDANSYLNLTWAMDNFNLEKKYGSLEKAVQNAKAEFLCIHLSSDWIFTPEESYKLAFTLLNQKKIVSSVELNTNLGHDGFLLEVKDLGNLLSRFLDVRIVEHRNENQVHHAFESKKDIDRISNFIPSNASILDIGCGDGRLLHTLWRKKEATGFGFDRSFEGVLHCLDYNVPIIQMDLDKKGLAQIADNSFDFVVFNRTLQETQNPRDVLLEILRIGRQAVVTFPNFGNWKVRKTIAFKGRMPKNKQLPHEWYNTPNIHLFTLSDFTELCKKEGIQIKKLEFVNSSIFSKILTIFGFRNLGAEQVVALISKGEI